MKNLPILINDVRAYVTCLCTCFAAACTPVSSAERCACVCAREPRTYITYVAWRGGGGGGGGGVSHDHVGIRIRGSANRTRPVYTGRVHPRRVRRRRYSKSEILPAAARGAQHVPTETIPAWRATKERINRSVQGAINTSCTAVEYVRRRNHPARVVVSFVISKQRYFLNYKYVYRFLPSTNTERMRL